MLGRATCAGGPRARTARSNVDDSLRITADGRFAIVVLRSAGEGSGWKFKTAWAIPWATSREMIPAGTFAALSDHAATATASADRNSTNRKAATTARLPKCMVYNRALSSAERRTLVSYLRRKYELDVLEALYPAGTMLMQAEDFDGPWQLVPRWDHSAMSWASGSGSATASGGRSSFHSPENTRCGCGAIRPGKESGLRTSVGGKPLAVTHVQGPRIPNWQLAGTVDLPAGETEIVVRGEGPGRKECDAVLVSPTITTLAGVEEICALARRLRAGAQPRPSCRGFRRWPPDRGQPCVGLAWQRSANRP